MCGDIQSYIFFDRNVCMGGGREVGSTKCLVTDVSIKDNSLNCLGPWSFTIFIIVIDSNEW